jgi:hypothetical protein
MSSVDEQPAHNLFAVATYVVLVVVLAAVLLEDTWVLNWEILGLLTLIAGYTLILVLPVTRFKISPSGVEAEVSRLKSLAPAPSPADESTREAETVVSQVSESLTDPRSVFLDLSIELEKRLRQLGASCGISQRMGMGQLFSELRRREVLTDPWLIEALPVFIQKRNQIVHEGKIELIQSAIEMGTVALGRLEQISGKPLFEKLVESFRSAQISFETQPTLRSEDRTHLYAPDFVLPNSTNPRYVIEVKGTLSISQAYALANVGRLLNDSYPDLKAILIANKLTVEMRNFLLSRYWAYAFEERQIGELISMLKQDGIE